MKEKSNPAISVILPIFNAGIYLRRCLDTLLSQTLSNIEIICIVDCPTDGSDLIIKEYARTDNRIKAIYNKSNLHVSQSRNIGLKLAQGEYIGFSDHDDWRELTMYESLYRIAKSDLADIVISNSFVIRNDITTIYKYKSINKDGIISSLILPMWHELNQNYLSKSVWASIYKRELIITNNIQFPERTKFYQEDTLFNIKAYIISKKISFVDQPFYYWNINENSTSALYTNNIAEKQINFFEYIIKELQKFELVDNYTKELRILITNLFFIHFDNYKKISFTEKIQLSRLFGYISLNLIDKKELSQLSKIKKLSIYFYLIKLYFLKLTSYS